MLHFAIKESGRSIQICCDSEGYATLVSAIEEIRATGNHIHLFAPSRGGRDLSDESPWGEAGASEVIITWGGD